MKIFLKNAPSESEKLEYETWFWLQLTWHPIYSVQQLCHAGQEIFSPPLAPQGHMMLVGGDPCWGGMGLACPAQAVVVVVVAVVVVVEALLRLPGHSSDTPSAPLFAQQVTRPPPSLKIWANSLRPELSFILCGNFFLGGDGLKRILWQIWEFLVVG